MNKKQSVVALVLFGFASGCPADEDGRNAPPIGSGPWTSATSGATGGGAGGESGSETGGGEGPTFVPCAVGGPGNCDPAEKCTPIGLPAPGWFTPWTVAACRPLGGPASGSESGSGGLRAVGELCQVFGGLSEGLDDCEEGSFCYSSDLQGKAGRCVELCADGQCSSGVCVVDNGGAFSACLDACDPLSPACESGDGCLPSGLPDTFACHVIQGGDGNGTGCAAKNGCSPGRVCVPVEIAGADVDSVDEALGYTCAEMCALLDPKACGIGDCVPVPGFQSGEVGVCSQ